MRDNVIDFPEQRDVSITGERLPLGMLEVEPDTFDKLVKTALLFDVTVDVVIARLIEKGLPT